MYMSNPLFVHQNLVAETERKVRLVPNGPHLYGNVLHKTYPIELLTRHSNRPPNRGPGALNNGLPLFTLKRALNRKRLIYRARIGQRASARGELSSSRKG